jgi:hypothetical protein
MMFYVRMSIELYIKYLCNIELCVVCEDLRKQYMLFTEKLFRFFFMSGSRKRMLHIFQNGK